MFLLGIIRFEVTGSGLTPGDPYEPPTEPEPDPEPEEPVIPEEPAGETVTLKVAQWWANYMNKEEVKAEVVAYLNSTGYDVVGLIHLPGDAFTDPAAFAAACGYEHYAWAFSDESVPRTDKVGHMILSKYPIDSYETVTIVADDGAVDGVEGRSMVYAVVDVEGTKIDVFCGENAGGGASDEQRAQMEALIKAEVDASGNDFVVFGYHYRATSEYAGKPVTQYSTGNTILASGALGLENGASVAKTNVGENTAGLPNIDPLFTADLIVTLPEQEPTTADMNVCLVPAFRFANQYAANADAIHEALKALGADVLAICQIDKNCQTRYNMMDVPGAIADALKEVYPYSYWVDAWEVDGGTNGHLLLSKYEIVETEKIVLNVGEADNNSNEGRAYGRAMLNVNGATVDVFFGWMSSNYWSTFGSIVGSSTADAWVVVGQMAYANPEFSGIQNAIGEPISAAFEHYKNNEGGYHFCNILSSGNGTFSGAKYEACTDRFGANADPLYQATITFTFA